MSFGIPVRNGLAVGLLASTFLSSLRIGGRPAMFLDFIGTNSLDSRITFTRTTTATFTDSSGVMQTAAIDTPRFDYDPATLAPKGLLMEEQRTNLPLQTDALATAPWSISNASYVGFKLTENSAVSSHQTRQQIILVSGTTYTVSAYLSSSSDRRLLLRLRDNLVTGREAFVIFDPATGLPTLTGGTTWTATALPPVATADGFRVAMSVTVNVSASVAVDVGLADSSNATTYAGNGTSGVFVRRVQVEAGAFATSYIPTVLTQITRTRDLALMTGTNFSSWYNASAGTFVSQFTTSNVSGTSTILDANDNTANESIRLRTVTTNPTFTVTDGGVDQANIDAGTVAANATYKMAGAYAANDFAASISGGAAVTDVSGAIPTVNQLQLGSASAGNALNGNIRSIAYYNTRLPNTTLQALTV